MQSEDGEAQQQTHTNTSPLPPPLAVLLGIPRARIRIVQVNAGSVELTVSGRHPRRAPFVATC